MAEVHVIIFTGNIFRNMTDITTVITKYKNNSEFPVMFQ